MPRDENSGPFEALIQAMVDRQSQLDLRMENVTLRVPFLGEAFELNGTISLSVHMRGLSDPEKQAHVSRSLKRLQP